jgi:penicillin amidase
VYRADLPLPTGTESYLTTLAPELLKELDDLPEEALREALERSVETVEESCGRDPGRWNWGALHAATLRHPLGIAGPLRDLLNRGPYPFGGDANTLRLASFRSGKIDGNGRPSFGPVTTGPNYRFIVDAGAWEKGWSMISPGQSGHPASASYDDQISLWLNVRYRPMVFGRKMAQLTTRHRLVLKPEEDQQSLGKP